MKRLGHAVVVLILLFAFLGIPALKYRGRIAGLIGADVDAVSGASVELPDSPSGRFYVLFNPEKHPDTADVWTDFFTEQPTDVIFEDLDCMVADGDEAAIQLAGRYQARLAENQMTVRRENGLMAVSKVQWGAFDVFVISEEMADAYRLDTVRDAAWITVTGGGE